MNEIIALKESIVAKYKLNKKCEFLLFNILKLSYFGNYEIELDLFIDFTYLSEKQIKTNLNKMVDKGIIARIWRGKENKEYYFLTDEIISNNPRLFRPFKR